MRTNNFHQALKHTIRVYEDQGFNLAHLGTTLNHKQRLLAIRHLEPHTTMMKPNLGAIWKLELNVP